MLKPSCRAAVIVGGGGGWATAIPLTCISSGAKNFGNYNSGHPNNIRKTKYFWMQQIWQKNIIWRTNKKRTQINPLIKSTNKTKSENIKDTFQEPLNHISQKKQIKQVKGKCTQRNLSQSLPQDLANLQLKLANNYFILDLSREKKKISGAGSASEERYFET